MNLDHVFKKTHESAQENIEWQGKPGSTGGNAVQKCNKCGKADFCGRSAERVIISVRNVRRYFRYNMHNERIRRIADEGTFEEWDAGRSQEEIR